MSDQSGEKVCLMCGQPLPLSTGRGRPRYWHDDCRKLNQLLGWTEDQIMKIKFSDQRKRELRSHLWYLANLMNGKDK